MVKLAAMQQPQIQHWFMMILCTAAFSYFSPSQMLALLASLVRCCIPQQLPPIQIERMQCMMSCRVLCPKQQQCICSAELQLHRFFLLFVLSCLVDLIVASQRARGVAT